MRMLSAIAVVAAFGVAACTSTTQLSPAPGAQPAPPGIGTGAIASNAGVTIEARADAWQGNPATLEREITPILVEVTNSGNHPLLVRYSAFQLMATNGKVHRAMPPFAIDEEITEEYMVRTFPYSGFTVAPYLRRYYPGLVLADPFLLDRAFYDTMVPVFRRVRLPTGDMVQKALPEGILAPGSKVAGFLYFEDVKEGPGVTLSANLIDASTQAEIGKISIPFVTH
jgi:hypothetical protein